MRAAMSYGCMDCDHISPACPHGACTVCGSRAVYCLGWDGRPHIGPHEGRAELWLMVARVVANVGAMVANRGAGGDEPRDDPSPPGRNSPPTIQSMPPAHKSKPRVKVTRSPLGYLTARERSR
jgi:hypothetical protein